MTFPAAPREITAELYLAGGWRDITSDVYQRDPITISRGRRNEGGGVDPASASLTLNNRSGNYSARNPVGAWFGHLGRNTPLRISITRARDAFGRTTSNGWGTGDVGGAWTTEGGSAGDYATAGGFGTHTVGAASTTRACRLGGVDYRDVDVALTWDVTFSNVTGGNIGVDVWLRRTGSTATGYLVRCYVSAAEVVTMDIIDAADASVVAAAAVVTGLTHDGTPIRVRAQVDGQTVRGKAWRASGVEPFDWAVEGHDEVYTSGNVGVRSVAYASNTNVPFTASVSDVEARSTRFHGEVADWPARTDTSGNDAYVQIEAGGIRRRLTQGGSSLQSSMRRSTPFLPDLVMYWPMEDGATADQLESGLLSGGTPMYRSGPVKFASNSEFACSQSIPTLNGGILFARPRPYTITGETQVRALLAIPSSGGTPGSALLWWVTSGTAALWMLVYEVTGDLRLRAYTAFGLAPILDSGAIGFNLDGRIGQIGVQLVQAGSDIEWNIDYLEVEAVDSGGFGGTLAGYTVGRITDIQINMDGGNAQLAVGHLTVENNITAELARAEELNAYATGAENSGSRIQRLCTDNSIPFAYVGLLNATAMGPQPFGSIMSVMDDAADATDGTLIESRAAHALVFRSRSSRYNVAPAVTFTYSAGHLAPPFEPVDDDQRTRNDVTYKRAAGASTRIEQTEGRLSVDDPADGGAGRYQVVVTGNTYADADNPLYAGWWLHLGTIDEPRFPRIGVNLANRTVAAHATLPSALLDLDVDDRVAVTGAAEIGFYDLIEQRVLGYSEHLSAFRHDLVLNCAPASAYDIAVTDDVTAKVDGEFSTLASGITNSATSLSVATSSGALWATAAGQMPIPIVIGGEEMSVTAISGGSSPQTFTVTRSVNGVVKAHSAGAGVRVRPRPTVAL